MTKETILKRLLIEGHITVQELIVLGQNDLYDTREPHSFPPIVYGPSKLNPPFEIYCNHDANPYLGPNAKIKYTN